MNPQPPASQPVAPPFGPDVGMRQNYGATAMPDVPAAAPRPAARRRLSPLETAAALAVTLSCLVATALMTGVLPVAGQAGGGSATTAAQAGSASLQRLEAAAGPHVGPPSGTSAPADPPAAASITQTARNALPTNIPLPAAPVPAGIPTANTVASAPATATPHTRPRHALPTHQRQQAAAVSSRGKTRNEVIAELLQAKRDGSYSSVMETYR